MDISKKAKDKIDEASKEIGEAIDKLKHDVAELTHKVKDRLKGTGDDIYESVEAVAREVKGFSDKVKPAISKYVTGYASVFLPSAFATLTFSPPLQPGKIPLSWDFGLAK